MVIHELAEIMVPIGVCVALPVLIVWLVMRAATNADNKRAEVLLAAIKSNASIDADKLAEAMAKPRKTPREILNKRLLRGVMFSLMGIVLGIIDMTALVTNGSNETFVAVIAGLLLSVGISYLVVYFATRRSVEEAEKNARK